MRGDLKMRKFILLIIALVMVLTLVACTIKEPPQQDSPVVENPVKPDEVTEQPADTDADTMEVTLYFANKKYTETGDETVEKLISETRTVEVKDENIEDAVIRELMKGPESDELSNVIPPTAKLLGVQVDNGTAVVDFASEGLNGGSMQEFFTLNQIIASLLEMEGVDRVKFLVDGKETDSLMGHYGIEEPFDKIWQ